MVILPKLWSFHIYFLIQNLGISWIWLLKFTRKRNHSNVIFVLNHLKKSNIETQVESVHKNKTIHMWHLSLQQLPKGWLEVRSWNNGSWKEETIQLWHFWLQLFPKELLEETFWSFHEKKKKSFKCSIYSRVQKSRENWSVCSKMALGEVGVSLPWWCHALVLLAPGY